MKKKEKDQLKQTIHFTVDPDVKAWLCEEARRQRLKPAQFVNRLFAEEMKGSRSKATVRPLSETAPVDAPAVQSGERRCRENEKRNLGGKSAKAS